MQLAGYLEAAQTEDFYILRSLFFSITCLPSAYVFIDFRIWDMLYYYSITCSDTVQNIHMCFLFAFLKDGSIHGAWAVGSDRPQFSTGRFAQEERRHCPSSPKVELSGEEVDSV